ncbi:hypothetical protein TURU_067439 [Turdus rufiventris]|nr:hypothetical protein TURU_067439 [Turdus rufiventris]
MCMGHQDMLLIECNHQLVNRHPFAHGIHQLHLTIGSKQLKQYREYGDTVSSKLFLYAAPSSSDFFLLQYKVEAMCNSLSERKQKGKEKNSTYIKEIKERREEKRREEKRREEKRREEKRREEKRREEKRREEKRREEKRREEKRREEKRREEKNESHIG